MLLSDERAALNFRGRELHAGVHAQLQAARLAARPTVCFDSIYLRVLRLAHDHTPHARHDSPRHMQHATRDVDKRITRRPERRAPSTATAHRSDEGSSGEVTLSRSITLSHLGVAGAVTCISSFESASLHASVDFALFAN